VRSSSYSRLDQRLQASRIFVLRLRAEPHLTDPIRSLRALLKAALRRYGLRCLEAIEVREGQP
jgi:hypothetical protein